MGEKTNAKNMCKHENLWRNNQENPCLTYHMYMKGTSKLINYLET